MGTSETSVAVLDSEVTCLSGDEDRLKEIINGSQIAGNPISLPPTEQQISELTEISTEDVLDPGLFHERIAYHYRTMTIPGSLESLEHPEPIDKVDDSIASFRKGLSYLAKYEAEVDDETFTDWVVRFHAVFGTEKIPAIDHEALPGAMA